MMIAQIRKSFPELAKNLAVQNNLDLKGKLVVTVYIDKNNIVVEYYDDSNEDN